MLSLHKRSHFESCRHVHSTFVLLNDDYTPMEFVVHILERYFGTSGSQAYELMMVVHQKGLAVVGVFSHDIAETKVMQVTELARKHQHPLQCTMEKE